MNIGDLKAVLDKYRDDVEVIIARDSEGTAFSPLEEYDEALYEPLSIWHGKRIPGNWDDSTEERPPGALAVLMLWPVN